MDVSRYNVKMFHDIYRHGNFCLQLQAPSSLTLSREFASNDLIKSMPLIISTGNLVLHLYMARLDICAESGKPELTIRCDFPGIPKVLSTSHNDNAENSSSSSYFDNKNLVNRICLKWIMIVQSQKKIC